MNHRLLFLAVFLLTFCGTVQNAHARRGIPIPIFWGHGEKMTEMGELPPEAFSHVPGELGTRVTVAFLNERVHVFYVDLWTWNGRHVLHSGDMCWEPDSTAWRQMIGVEPSTKYGKPLLYRIPLVPALLIVTVGGFFVCKHFFMTDQEKLEALLIEQRFQSAIETSDDGAMKDAYHIAAEQMKRHVGDWEIRSSLIKNGLDEQSAARIMRDLSDARSEEIRRRLRT